MKTKNYLLLIIVFFQFNLFAQDIIVKTKNDTIDCIIIRVTDEFIKYQIHDGYNLKSKTLNSEEYISYKEDFYQQTETNTSILKLNHTHYIVTNNSDTIYCNILSRPNAFIVYYENIDGKRIVSKKRKIEIAETSRIKKTSTKQAKSYVEISFQGGYGSRFGSIPSSYNQAQKQVSEDLKTGYYLGGGIRAYITSNFGLGINFSSYNSTTSGYIPIILNDDPEYYETDFKLSINYISAEVLYTFYNKNKDFSFSPFINVGLIYYKETSEIENIEIILKGNDLGWGIGGNMIFYMTPNFGFMLKGQAIFGTLSEIEVGAPNVIDSIELPEGESISTGRLELGGGFVIKI